MTNNAIAKGSDSKQIDHNPPNPRLNISSSKVPTISIEHNHIPRTLFEYLFPSLPLILLE